MYPFPFRKRFCNIGQQIRSMGVDSMTDLIHGNIVSYQAEDIYGDGEYGVLVDDVTTPLMLWPGLTKSFLVGVEEAYDETQHLGAHGDTSLLANVRNMKMREELPFSAEIVPQKTLHWPLLQFIVGGTGAFSDEVDSTSWIKELDSKFSVFTGIMLESLKVDIPEQGIAKQSLSGFGGHQIAPSIVDPVVTHATANTSDPVTWNDITSIKMDATATPSTVITHCIGDISFGWTSTIAKRKHPESSLSTKMCGVRVMERKMEVSLTLTYVDQTFISLVTAGTSQNIQLKIGTTPNETTFTFKGLRWPKYIAKAEPNDIIGDTITALTDQPSFTYATA